MGHACVKPMNATANLTCKSKQTTATIRETNKTNTTRKQATASNHAASDGEAGTRETPRAPRREQHVPLLGATVPPTARGEFQPARVDVVYLKPTTAGLLALPRAPPPRPKKTRKTINRAPCRYHIYKPVTSATVVQLVVYIQDSRAK